MQPNIMTTRTLVLIIALAFTTGIHLHGQVGFYAQLSTNYPLIPDTNPTPPNINPMTGYSSLGLFGVKETFEPKVGAGIEIGAEKNLSERWSIQAGLGIRMIRFKRISTIVAFDAPSTSTLFPAGTPTRRLYPSTFVSIGISDSISVNQGLATWAPEVPSDLGLTKIFYLDIPVLVSFDIIKDRLSLAGGLTCSVPFYSEIVTMSGTDKTGDGINNLLFGARASVDVRLYNQFWLGLGYDYSISNIYDSGDKKYHQLSAAISYFF